MQEKSERVHPCLPTSDEVKADPSLLYSDHIPLLFEIQVSGKNKINAITYNVCAGNPSGYDEVYEFALDKENERHLRIANGLKTFSDKPDNPVDVILLQEVSNEQLSVLKTSLGNEWEILHGLDLSQNSTVTCYRKNKLSHNVEDFNCPKMKDLRQEVKSKQDVILTSTIPGDRFTIKLTNFWGNFFAKDHVDDEDNNYNSFVEDINDALNNEQTVSVVAGDFNNPIRRVNGQKNVTNLGVPQFTKISDAAFSLDGALCQKSGQIAKNLKAQAIDLGTCTLINNETLNVAKTDGSIHDDDRPLLSNAVIIQSIKNCLDAEIIRLQTPRWYLWNDKAKLGKAAALIDLKQMMIEKLNGVDESGLMNKIKETISMWEQKPHPAQNGKTNATVIDEHRFIFFSEKRWSKNATTRARDAINALKQNVENATSENQNTP